MQLPARLVCSIEETMRCSHYRLLWGFLILGLDCPHTRAATTNDPAQVKGTNTSARIPTPLSPSSTNTSRQIIGLTNAPARAQAQAGEKVLSQEERQKEIRRIELEVLKAAEARKQKADATDATQASPPPPAAPVPSASIAPTRVPTAQTPAAPVPAAQAPAVQVPATQPAARTNAPSSAVVQSVPQSPSKTNAAAKSKTAD